MTVREENTFADSNLWLELAKERKLRLPLWRMACTTGGMRKYLKKLNVSVDDYLTYSGERILKDFPRRNPEWPLRAWVGLLLEWLSWKDLPAVPSSRATGNEAETFGEIVNA